MRSSGAAGFWESLGDGSVGGDGAGVAQVHRGASVERERERVLSDQVGVADDVVR